MKNYTRSQLREKIMFILYQINVYQKNNITFQIEEVIKENIEIENEFVKETVFGVLTEQNKIDDLANKYLEKWTIDRLGFPDQAIIRIAIYELIYTEIPEIVAINEAIELAKKYSDDEVRKMINSILDKIYHAK